jgi:hypothetical protein
MFDDLDIVSSRMVTTNHEIIYILGMRDGGAEFAYIAERVGKDKSTISCIILCYSWETFNRRTPRTPNLRVTTEHDDRMLVRTVLNNCRTTLGDITNKILLAISPAQSNVVSAKSAFRSIWQSKNRSFLLNT